MYKCACECMFACVLNTFLCSVPFDYNQIAYVYFLLISRLYELIWILSQTDYHIVKGKIYCDGILGSDNYLQSTLSYHPGTPPSVQRPG